LHLTSTWKPPLPAAPCPAPPLPSINFKPQ
jgi:hypothetical protein